MTQITRPGATASSTGWTVVGAADAHSAVNEVAADDANYVNTTEDDILRVSYDPVNNPNTTAGHIVRYRVQGNVLVRFMQGATTIVSWSHDDANPTTYAQTLTAVQATAITNYADLHLEVEVEETGDLPLLLHVMTGGKPLYGNYAL